MMVSVFIDGAARGNPGPGGLGVVIYKNGEENPLREIKGFLGVTTNNQAEYMALIRALEELRKFPVKEAKIYSDSQLLIRQMNGEYRVRHENLIPLYDKAIKIVERIPRVTFHFIRREKNKKADKLANMGIDEA